MANWRRLECLKPERIRKLQDSLLKDFIKYQIPYHPYYRELFKKSKIKFSGIKTTNDLEKLPFTTKESIAPSKQEPKKFLDFILQPNRQLIKQHAAIDKKIKIIFNKKHIYHEYKPVHIHFTTGRSAMSVPVFYTPRDLQMLEESGRRMMDVLNVSDNSVVINAFPYAPHLAFWQAFYAIKGANLLSLNTGGGKILGTEKILRSIRSMKASLLAGMPGYLYHLVRAGKASKIDLSTVELVVFGGERVPMGLRDKVKGYLRNNGARILSTYAFTEGKTAWVECNEDSGYHLYPDFEYIEVVDKDGKRVGEGEKGEIVYTSLDWRGTVLLRYKTGDITNGIYYEKCRHCKRNLPRLGGNIERKSEYTEFRLTKIKGSFVNLNVFFPIMMANKDIEEWQIEIKKRNNNPYEIDELILYVAPRKNADIKRLKQSLKNRIFSETEVNPSIILVSLKELLGRLGMETELKEKRIIDSRKKL
ncbi:AMP-binding protein [Candidatus Woesearchaeota archaeon]|nr:AMP-binding protein [Candidatus Woesearchaeota archaeon]